MTALGPPAGGLRLIRLALVGLAVGVCVNTCGVVVSFVLNADRVDQINAERAENIRRNCEDVNARNHASRQALDKLLAQRMTQASPERIRQSRANTRVLIDTLAPRRDCVALARDQVSNP